MEVDDPIDYSTPAWRLAKKVNDYFAGWEPLPEYYSYAEYPGYDAFVRETFGTSDAETQTPKEWAFSEPAQRPTEVERVRAEPRKRDLPPGTRVAAAPVR